MSVEKDVAQYILILKQKKKTRAQRAEDWMKVKWLMTVVYDNGKSLSRLYQIRLILELELEV